VEDRLKHHQRTEGIVLPIGASERSSSETDITPDFTYYNIFISKNMLPDLDRLAVAVDTGVVTDKEQS